MVRTFERVILLCVACLATLVLFPRRALALPVTCVAADDCDGDGIPNEADPCPAPAAGDNPSSTILHGFRDVACYRRATDALTADGVCTAVAVRPFDADVPPYPDTGAATHVRGFTWVGVLNAAVIPNPTGKLAALKNAMATPTEVAASFRDPNKQPVPNALFACMGSVKFVTPTPGLFGGSGFAETPTVYSYRLTMSYVRAMADAASNAAKLKYPSSDPSSFADGLGLITDVCTAESPTGVCWRRGLVGTNGTWYEWMKDWDTVPDAVLLPDEQDLPEVVNEIHDRACEEKKAFDYLVQIIKDKVTPVSQGIQPLPEPDPAQLMTPFGMTPVQFTGGPIGNGGGTPFAASGKDEFTEVSPLVTRATADFVQLLSGNCTFQTDAPNFAFVLNPQMVLTDHALDHQLVGWKEFMQQDAPPRAYTSGVTGFFAKHTHAVNSEVDQALSWNLLMPNPPSPPPHRTALADSAMLVSLEKSGTQVPYTVINAGSAVGGILKALHWWHFSPLVAPWTVDAGGTRTLGIYNLGKTIDTQDYDYAKQVWVETYEKYGQQPDYAEITAPVSWFSSDGTGLSQARVSVHVGPSKWHPAGDLWLTNAATSRCPTLASTLGSFPSNSSYSVAEQWCRDNATLANVPELKDWESRIQRCSVDNYDPGTAVKHWPPLHERTPFLALWGHLKTPGAPTGHFPGGDLVKAGITKTAELHEGQDFNWEFNTPYIEDPEVLGNHPNKVCYSQFDVVTTVQVALSCSDPGFAVCGSLAQGGDCCNPLEQYWEEYKKEIADACSCDTPDCDTGWDPSTWGCPFEKAAAYIGCGLKEIVSCAPTIAIGGIKFIYQTAYAYASDVCVPFTGKSCSGNEGFSICSNSYAAAKGSNADIENEFEYNMAFGGRVNQTGRTTGFEYPPDCTKDNLVGIPYECKWFEDDPAMYQPANWIWLGGNTVLHPSDAVVSQTHDGAAAGWMNNGVGAIEGTLPMVLGPGMFGKPETAWSWMSTTTGFGQTSSVKRIMVPPADVHAIGQSILTKANVADQPFRLEMLGDLIVDCGHAPFRTEVHPPVAMALHLGGSSHTRYSIFGWHRKSLDRDPIDIDLWPDAPRPSASAKLQQSVVFDGGFGSGPGSWSCAPFPSDWPNRIRCTLVAGSADGGSGCDDNPHSRPACATDVAGGLVEVWWQ